MEKDEIPQQPLLGRAGRLVEALQIIGPGAAVQLGVPVRVTPAQVGGQRLACQVVGEEPARPRLDE